MIRKVGDKMIEENDLVKRAKAGDLNAYEQIIILYEKKVFGLIYNLIKNYDELEDIAQEVFIKVYRNLKNFKEESSLYTWIYRITVNVCIDEMKKRRKVVSIDEKIQLDDGEVDFQIPDNGKSLEEILEEKDERLRLMNCINKLPESARTMIVLRDIKEFSYQEISEILNINIGTVKSKINRARELLKKLLGGVGTYEEPAESNEYQEE
jgi:RNA polymerase sigma-70 factor (ECF subfamily)